MAYEHQSCSIDGRFELQVEPLEARDTHWILAPQMRDTINDRLLSSLWRTPGLLKDQRGNAPKVRIDLRQYPGDQRRPCLEDFVDWEREVGRVEGGELLPLNKLEAELDRLLSSAA